MRPPNRERAPNRVVREQSGSRPLRSLVHCWGMAPMRNFLVPQTTQVAWAAARPFFMVTAFRSADSVLALHLTQ